MTPERSTAATCSNTAADPPHPESDDRRSTLIEITPDGRAAADQLLPGIRTLEKSILSALSYEERAHLLDLLAKILTRAAEVATD